MQIPERDIVATSTGGTAPANRPAPAIDADAVVDQAMDVSRALVDIAARSLIGIGDDITLPQYRVLVLVDGGTSRGVDLARLLGVHSSTSSRLIDKLVAKGLLDRRPDPQDRRSNALSITPEGHRLVTRVNARRRAEMQDLFEHLKLDEVPLVLEGLQLFNVAAAASGHGTPTAPTSTGDAR